MKSLIIRRAEKADVPAIKAIYEQPHAYEGTLQFPYPSEETWHARHDNATPEYHNLLAEVDGRVVGQLGLMTERNPRRKHVAHFGMGVCASMLGQGVGSALLSAALEMCDNWLNIERVELEVYSDNAAALALYKKFGFVVEGERKRWAFKNGKYVDVVCMAKLKSTP